MNDSILGVSKTGTISSKLAERLLGARMPQNTQSVIYVKISGLEPTAHHNPADYRSLSKKLLKELSDVGLGQIWIPSFSYSVLEKHHFSRRGTESEVGRFSEEVRRMVSHENRTNNPVFSYVTPQDGVESGAQFQDSAFGTGSTTSMLANEGHLILNVNLPTPITATHLHWLEHKWKVPYRANIQRVISTSEIDGHENSRSYSFFARKNTDQPGFNRTKIREVLLDAGVWHEASLEGTHFGWAHSKEVDGVLEKYLKSEPSFLIS